MRNQFDVAASQMKFEKGVPEVVLIQEDHGHNRILLTVIAKSYTENGDLHLVFKINEITSFDTSSPFIYNVNTIATAYSKYDGQIYFYANELIQIHGLTHMAVITNAVTLMGIITHEFICRQNNTTNMNKNWNPENLKCRIPSGLIECTDDLIIFKNDILEKPSIVGDESNIIWGLNDEKWDCR